MLSLGKDAEPMRLNGMKGMQKNIHVQNIRRWPLNHRLSARGASHTRGASHCQKISLQASRPHLRPYEALVLGGPEVLRVVLNSSSVMR